MESHEKTRQPRAKTPPPRIGLAINEAVDVSGIGRSVLYQLMRAGRLPYVKIGRRRLIKAADLEALLDRNRQGEAA